MARAWNESRVNRDRRGRFAHDNHPDTFVQRLSDHIGQQRGRKLTEDEQDLADELTSVGAAVHPDGTVTAYHYTTQANADRIRATGRMAGLEDGLFFTTKPDGGQGGAGRGGRSVELRLPLGEVQLDDMFDDEAHLRVPTRRAGQQVDVSRWLA